MLNRGRKTIEIFNGYRKIKLGVHLADTPRKREQGLKFVRFLPENEGMLFVFPEVTCGSFWMKDTYIPLSIAFLDSYGRILKILHMEPCVGENCPFYHPGVFYQYAIEVNLGWFERNGIRAGDYVGFLD